MAGLKRRPADRDTTGASAHYIDPDEERDPPAKPTPLTFPSVEPVSCRTWDDATPPPNFQALFTRVLKPADISETHLQALNIDLQGQCYVEKLLPPAPDGSSYILPLPSEEVTSVETSDAPASKTAPSPARKRKEFDDRIKELQVDNMTAYRVITRNTQPGTKLPRLAYMRTFWQGLESMSQYWDCTLDQYYSVTEQDNGGEKSPKRQKVDTSSETAGPDEANNEARNVLPVRTPSREKATDSGAKTSNEGDDPSSVNGSESLSDSNADAPTTSRTNKMTSMPRSTMRYKGFRTNSGRYMPERFRVDAIRGFVEGTVWPFQCNVYPPRMMPLVHLNKLKLPVRQTLVVNRLPQDRARAKEGGLVGPVLGVQVRPDTDFHDNDESKARLDLMREIGGLLQLAQERAREGKTEVKPGEGKWWTTVPRWGGGPGGEVENPEGNSDIVDIAAELLGATKGENGKEASRKRQKKTPARLWKELKCGSGYFDPKTDYAAIGKDPTSNIDEVHSPSLCLSCNYFSLTHLPL